MTRRDPRLDGLMGQALTCKNRNDFRGAAKILASTVLEFPDCAGAWGLLGSIYLLELRLPKKALHCFEKATQLSPRSEMASLGLFHALWRSRKRSRAVAELKRFQSVSHSKDYAEIAAELKELGLWKRLERVTPS